MRVLIVDDSKTMRNIVKGVVQTLGAKAVEEAGDGQDALSRVDAFGPDIILLDWNMPIMDGLTFVRTYRAKGKQTPIIMVTTEAEKARVMEAIKAGVNNYAVKPFTPEGLSKIIEITLAKAAVKAA
ncbi:MAG: response regulator [Planctomycetota bacterium]|nr:response regulator [Planctomycetota bacterium]